jgi:glycosyltransferase involved in cell wall biosynthesis
MKILYHIPYYKPALIYGGPTITTANLCEALVTAGAEVTVITTNANGKERLSIPLKQALNLNGVTVYYYPLGFTSRYFYSPSLLNDFASHIVDYDIVVLDALMTYLLYGTTRIARKYSKPYIIPVRGQLFPWSLAKNRLLKKIYLAAFQNSLQEAAALHCTTVEEVEAIKQLGLSTPTFVIPNSMDTQAFVNLNSDDTFRTQLGISPDTRILLQLGRIINIKRPDIALEVLSKSPEDVHLIFAGPCEFAYQEELLNAAQQKGCRERVHFTGLLNENEVKQALAAADILLMPSEVQENFGMAAAEALAAGLPVIASKNIPIAQWAAGEAAAICLECDGESFAYAVQGLLENEAYRRNLGQAAQRFAQNKLDNREVGRQTLLQYEDILDKN